MLSVHWKMSFLYNVDLISHTRFCNGLPATYLRPQSSWWALGSGSGCLNQMSSQWSSNAAGSSQISRTPVQKITDGYISFHYKKTMTNYNKAGSSVANNIHFNNYVPVMRPGQNGNNFADDIFKLIFHKGNLFIFNEKSLVKWTWSVKQIVA